jgi:transposase-like protein
MAFHIFLFLLVVCLVLLTLARLGRLDWLAFQPSHSRGGAKRSSLTRLLKPRCPDDCPACRLASPASSSAEPAPAPVRPWSEVKSRRGAPKRIPTEGFACPKRQCTYFGNTDAHRHALVGDGKHGKAEPIQTFRCQACHTTFSARLNTPLYRLKTPSQQVAVVLSARACGLDPSAAARVFGFRQATITSLSDPSSPCTRRRCTSASSPLCTFPISSWTNCAPGCAAPHTCCGFGWSSIKAPRFCPCCI